jgi:hypothetical protein
MSSADFYKWRAKPGGADAPLIAEMKDMAEQNRHLKTMLEPSPSFRLYFGHPECTETALDQNLGAVLPIGKQRMTKPTSLQIKDKNEVLPACLAETFKTSDNECSLLNPTIVLTLTAVQGPKSYPL